MLCRAMGVTQVAVSSKVISAIGGGRAGKGRVPAAFATLALVDRALESP